jgi:hypothetical protein
MRPPLEQVAAATFATVPETVRDIVKKELFERLIEQSKHSAPTAPTSS